VRGSRETREGVSRINSNLSKLDKPQTPTGQRKERREQGQHVPQQGHPNKVCPIRVITAPLTPPSPSFNFPLSLSPSLSVSDQTTNSILQQLKRNIRKIADALFRISTMTDSFKYSSVSTAPTVYYRTTKS
jgi:hypothetical protein